MSNHHINIQGRDQMQATLEDKLDDFVKRSRELREARQEKFGSIDQFRVVRDQAVILHKLSPEAKSMILAAAIDRLAQLPDFEPASDLEAMFALDPQEDK